MIYQYPNKNNTFLLQESNKQTNINNNNYKKQYNKYQYNCIRRIYSSLMIFSNKLLIGI